MAARIRETVISQLRRGVLEFSSIWSACAAPDVGSSPGGWGNCSPRSRGTSLRGLTRMRRMRRHSRFSISSASPRRSSRPKCRHPTSPRLDPEPRMGRDHPAPGRRFHLRCRLGRRSGSAVELARLDNAREVDRDSRHTWRPSDQRHHRTGLDRHAHHQTLPYDRRRRTVLPPLFRTEHRPAHSRSCSIRGPGAGSDRDLGLSRPPRS